MNIESAKYDVDKEGNKISIIAIIDGNETTVPLEPDNRHYAEIMNQVEDGTLTIESAS